MFGLGDRVSVPSRFSGTDREHGVIRMMELRQLDSKVEYHIHLDDGAMTTAVEENMEKSE